MQRIKRVLTWLWYLDGNHQPWECTSCNTLNMGGRRRCGQCGRYGPNIVTLDEVLIGRITCPGCGEDKRAGSYPRVHTCTGCEPSVICTDCFRDGATESMALEEVLNRDG